MSFCPFKRVVATWEEGKNGFPEVLSDGGRGLGLCMFSRRLLPHFHPATHTGACFPWTPERVGGPEDQPVAAPGRSFGLCSSPPANLLYQFWDPGCPGARPALKAVATGCPVPAAALLGSGLGWTGPWGGLFPALGSALPSGGAEGNLWD